MRGKFMRTLGEMLTSENIWSKLRSLEKQTQEIRFVKNLLKQITEEPEQM